ncbi:MAG: hypothetical protein CSB13_06585, partial [Chloroflexi bacterium]
VGLGSKTLSDLETVIQHLSDEIDPSTLAEIKNRELRAILEARYNLVPSDPEGFLRYAVKELTGETLLIKNRDLIQKIKWGDGELLDIIMEEAPHDLASIFYRFKPIFLAMKSISNDKRFYNRLRKQAKHMHKPVSAPYLTRVTQQMKEGNLDLAELKGALGNASLAQKVRLLHALRFRLQASDSIVYQVRNGRGFATDFAWGVPKQDTRRVLATVIADVADTLRPRLEGKTIRIPQGVHYAIPTSEKQFVGNVPAGSYLSTNGAVILGIHWLDLEIESGGYAQVDLDLSFRDANGKIGWDGTYRVGDRILFSGDLTKATRPEGAAELVWVSDDVYPPKTVSVNVFGVYGSNGFELDPDMYNPGAHSMYNPIEARFVMAQSQQKPDNFKGGYMIDPDEITYSTPLAITTRQINIGHLERFGEENRFYFTNTSLSCGRSARNTTILEKARDFYSTKLPNMMMLNDIIPLAGGAVVAEEPIEGECIDLSLQYLDKSTLLDLVM